MWIGYGTKQAAATTAYVVTFSSFSGFLGHMPHMAINPRLMIVTVIAVVVASLLGSSFMVNLANAAPSLQAVGQGSTHRVWIPTSSRAKTAFYP